MSLIKEGSIDDTFVSEESRHYVLDYQIQSRRSIEETGVGLPGDGWSLLGIALYNPNGSMDSLAGNVEILFDSEYDNRKVVDLLVNEFDKMKQYSRFRGINPDSCDVVLHGFNEGYLLMKELEEKVGVPVYAPPAGNLIYASFTPGAA